MSQRTRAIILGCGPSPGVPRLGNDWGLCDPNEPKNRRTRTSLLIERFGTTGNRPTRILVDTGPDVRAQLLAANVGAVDAVIYTHAHADHTHGIDELRVLAQNMQRLVDVYADEATAAHLEYAFAYCFTTSPDRLYPPFLRMHRVTTGAPLTIGGPGGEVTLLPLRQAHGEVDSLCLKVGELAYSCDVSDLPPETERALAGLGVWIVDGLRDTPHVSHFSVSDALGRIERLRPKRAVLTHMTNDLDYAALKRRLPSHVEPAYDGMIIEFSAEQAARSTSMDQVP